MIDIIGGVYREQCLHPHFDEIYGSGGRGASVITSLGAEATLHSVFSTITLEVCGARSVLEGFRISPMHNDSVAQDLSFFYENPLAEPRFTRNILRYDVPDFGAERVLQYGMLECDPIVFAESVVFDPQNRDDTRFFRSNGSQAERLAHVLNYREAYTLTHGAEERPGKLAALCAAQSASDVVVIKMGAKGALVWDKGEISTIPAFETRKVWSIGSGDTFAAAFAYYWLERGAKAQEAARYASLATAFYCSTGGFASQEKIQSLDYKEVSPSALIRDGYRPKLYLAGPFFNLGQLWLVENARNNLIEAGFEVLSPYHDIGRGSADEVVQDDLDAINSCDLVFAIADGLDSGTMYEVGYARALNKEVVVYSEIESDQDLKMMVGSNCLIESDYTTAIYKSLWLATQL